jgi:hypothetical protein
MVIQFDLFSFDNWTVLGDFNFFRSLIEHNKPGGSASDMMLLNGLIQHLVLAYFPFQGRKYTRSNMQDDPLLENLTGFLLHLCGP